MPETVSSHFAGQIDQFLEEQPRSGKTPSVYYILFDPGKIIHECRFGLADIKNQKEVDEQSTFHAFSITKTFTALAILQLAQQQKLGISDRADKYLPAFPYPGNITIKNLLNHTSGIPNPVPVSWIHLENEHKGFNSTKFFAPVFQKHKIKSLPNERYSYSNPGYILLGQIIEAVSGHTYEQYILNHIIEPLQLQSTELGFTTDDHLAKGYLKKISLMNGILGFLLDKEKYTGETEGKWKPFRNFYLNGAAYGGLMGTPHAFMRYLQELLKPNCILISDDQKKLLFTENYTNDGRPSGMCMSWFKGMLNGRTYFCHAGGGGGFYCEARIYPEENTGSVIFFNRTGMSDERFLDKTDKYYFKKT